MIASRSAFSIPESELPPQDLGREQTREPRARGGWLIETLFELRLRIRVWHAQPHELLVTSALRQPFEVAADGRAHVLELALLAHGGTFPTGATTPAFLRGTGIRSRGFRCANP